MILDREVTGVVAGEPADRRRIGESQRVWVFTRFGVDECRGESEAVGLAVGVELVDADPERRRALNQKPSRVASSRRSDRASGRRATSAARTLTRNMRQAGQQGRGGWGPREPAVTTVIERHCIRAVLLRELIPDEFGNPAA